MDTNKNELLCLFMGGLWNEHSNSYGIGNAEYVDYGKKKNVVRAQYHLEKHQLVYDSNWNYLIPVVDKIKSLGIVAFEDGFNLIEHIDYCLLSCDISSTFNACVSFLEWFNEKNK